MSPNTPEVDVAAGIDHHDVALLDMVEHVAMELLFGIGIFAVAIEIFALGHELQRQRRAADHLAAIDEVVGPSMCALRKPRWNSVMHWRSRRPLL